MFQLQLMTASSTADILGSIAAAAKLIGPITTHLLLRVFFLHNELDLNLVCAKNGKEQSRKEKGNLMGFWRLTPHGYPECEQSLSISLLSLAP